MTPIISKALEYLAIQSREPHIRTGGGITLDQPLAALIRQATGTFPSLRTHCRICGYPDEKHAPACALIKLCEAIAGEQP